MRSLFVVAFCKHYGIVGPQMIMPDHADGWALFEGVLNVVRSLLVNVIEHYAGRFFYENNMIDNVCEG